MTTKVVTQKQLFKYFSIHLITTVIMFMMGLLLQQSGFNAPHGIVIGVIIGLLITWFVFKFAKRRPDHFFVDYGAEIMTGWIHYPLMAIVVFTNFCIVAINIWEIQDFLLQFYLSGTPPWVIAMICGLCIAYMARYGIKSMFRAAEGLFYLTLLSFIIIPFLVRSNVEWFMAQGFVTHMSLREAWPTAYYIGAVIGEASLFLYIYPYISEATSSMRTITRVSLLSVFIIVLHIVPILLILGPDLAQNLNYPELDIIRLIKSGSFLEALDPVIISLWLISIFLKISFIIFVIGHIISRSLKLKYSKPIIFPISLFAVVCSLSIARTHTQFFSLHNGGVMTCIYFSHLIPFFYYFVDSIRRRRKQKEEDNL